MQKLSVFLLFTALTAPVFLKAQFSKHIVQFRDKAGTPFSISNPPAYLSAKSIARRTKQGIGIDSSDLPITPRYIDSIRSVSGVTLLNRSKWLNQVLINTTSPAALAKIQSFPFVKTVSAIAARLGPDGQPAAVRRKIDDEVGPLINGQQRTNGVDGATVDYGNSRIQIEMHNGQFLHNWGFLGNGMTISVMDAGFLTHQTNTGIDSLRINNQIKGTWDFVANEASVNEDDSHGFFCLSIMGANKPGQMVGSSPKADYYLYRTEDVFSEYPIEEQNWVAAAELADSIGADVFSTSLGYIDFDNPVFDHSYAQRNGNTAIMTIAGDLAAKKGIIVCNSAGNNGGSATDYKFVAVPADGDSVMAVGSCNANRVIANSSAWGPTSSGRTKPNFVSMGVSATIMGLGGTPSTGSGTSFANPNIAGLITCLWQAFYESGNMEVLDAVMQAGDRFASPDGRYGFGIPDMKKAFVTLLKRRYNGSAAPGSGNCVVNVNLNFKAGSGMQLQLERRGPGEPGFSVIKTVPVTGTAFQQHLAIVIDTLPYQVAGTVTYRLKHTMGADTSFYYPDFTTSLVTPCTGNNKILVLPNPFKNSLIIKIGGGLNISEAGIKITDASGRLVYAATQNSGLQNINIDTRRWAAGVYTVELLSNGQSLLVKRIVKE